jgi:tetratricopeptide (TPR) repeat protein
LKQKRSLDGLIASRPLEPTSYIQKANLLLQVGDLKQAYSAYTKALSLNPKSVAAWVNRGVVQRRLGNIASALIDYTQAINVAPGDPDAYRNRGIAREVTGDMAGAVSDWKVASSLGDKQASSWVSIVENPAPDPIAFTLSPVSSTGLSLDKVPPVKAQGSLISILPKNQTYIFESGRSKLLRKDYIGAIEDFTRSILLLPKHYRSLFNRAVAKRGLGDLAGALEDYNAALELAPGDQDVYRNRGIVKQLLGDQAGACADWGVAAGMGNKDAKSWIGQDCNSSS